MILPRIFRRTRPTPAPRPDIHEVKVMSAWGFTPAGWSALTNQERTGYRCDYVLAPRYVA